MPTLRLSRALFRSQAEDGIRSEEHTSELQSPQNLVCRLLLEKKKNKKLIHPPHDLRHMQYALTVVRASRWWFLCSRSSARFFFFNDTATTEIYTLSLTTLFRSQAEDGIRDSEVTGVQTCALPIDRKRTRLNSSHLRISYAVFCLRSEERRVGKECRSRWRDI